MFQPHSVRGLLSRRNQTRLHSEEQGEGAVAGGDTDFEAMVEAKLMIKDVEHKIEDIRQWRDHQRSMLEQKLACNEAVAKVTVEEYLSHIEREVKQEEEERQKMLKKLVVEQREQDEGQQKEWTSDTNLFQHLANSNRLVDLRKYEQEDEGEQLLANNQSFLNNLQSISGNILRREQGEKKKQGIDRQKLKRELQQIENELKEFQDLYRD